MAGADLSALCVDCGSDCPCVFPEFALASRSARPLVAVHDSAREKGVATKSAKLSGKSCAQPCASVFAGSNHCDAGRRGLLRVNQLVSGRQAWSDTIERTR